jgi:putative transposase
LLGQRRRRELFATLKVELVHNAAWATRAAARTELFEYLELFYNGQRRHSALGYLSPRAFERRFDVLPNSPPIRR